MEPSSEQLASMLTCISKKYLTQSEWPIKEKIKVLAYASHTWISELVKPNANLPFESSIKEKIKSEVLKVVSTDQSDKDLIYCILFGYEPE